jgi:DNA adenine methylase
LLSDLNRELIETYDVVRDHPLRVYQAVEHMRRDSRSYYAERSRSPNGLGRIRRAVRFIYLNRNCFNGIYRTNRDGDFNVPFATSKAGGFVTREEFVATARAFDRVTLKVCDFGKTLSQVDRGDFAYLDPPYAVSARRVFKQYGAREFGPNDLLRLSRHLVAMDRRGAYFLVSYADCREARELAEGWQMRRMRVRRHVAGFAGARRSTYELLISNFLPKTN